MDFIKTPPPKKLRKERGRKHEMRKMNTKREYGFMEERRQEEVE